MKSLLFPSLKRSNSLKSYIHYNENFCPLELCDTFIEESLCRNRRVSEVGGARRVKKIRDACDVSFVMSSQLIKELTQYFNSELLSYLSNFGFSSFNPHYLRPEVSIVSYKNQRGYIPHTDASLPFNEQGNSRFISAICYFNDDYIGGDIYFPEIGFSLKPKKGSCLIFPSDDLFKHGVKPVKGYKLISPCWFYYKSHTINPFSF